MHCPLRSRFLLNLVLVSTLGLGTAPLVAQAYRTVKIVPVGISITISKRLKGLPLRLDSSDPHLRARFRVADRKDYIKLKGGRRYEWYTDVFAFGKSAGPITPRGEDGKPKDEPEPEPKTEKEKAIAKARAAAKQTRNFDSFEAWLEPQQPQVVTRGKAVKKRGSKLPYSLWEYLTDRGGGFQWYNGAAVYKVDGREVVVLIRMPLPSGLRPTGPAGKACKVILASAKLLKEGDDELSDSATKDKFADTDSKKRSLEAAKKNIQGLRNWSYFTTPNYIVLFSWKKGRRGASYKTSKRLSAGLEKMRKLYAKYYAPEQGMKMPYSVFRVCGTYEQFSKYGSSPPGVVGWFSPRSKELVVFQGGAFGKRKGFLETVTFHEGWHQYSNAFFRGVELHRWFDEGHGDWFGAHVPRGKSFRYVGSGMRYKWVKLMVKKGDYVPFKKIVAWPRSKFYNNPRTAYFYAQAYGMIDFLRRGRSMGQRFDKSWSNILPTYRRVILEQKDAKIATEEAFKGVDYAAMTEAWKFWVNSPRFKKPR